MLNLYPVVSFQLSPVAILQRALEAQRREYEQALSPDPSKEESMEAQLANNIIGASKQIKEVFALHQALSTGLTEKETADINQRFNNFVTEEDPDKELRLLNTEQIRQLNQAA